MMRFIYPLAEKPNPTGLPGGSLGSSLQERRLRPPNPTGLPGGSLGSSLQECGFIRSNPTGLPGGSLGSLVGDTASIYFSSLSSRTGALYPECKSARWEMRDS